MAVIERTWTVEARGVGYPDYERKIHSGRERAGIQLEYNQSLISFYVIFTPFTSPFGWVKPPLAVGIGTHTAAVHATVMTNAIANFIPNELVGDTIHNVTDGSAGTITANTATTVTVAALAGGTTDQWNTNDAYAIGAHLAIASTGFDMPYTLPEGYTISLVQDSFGFKEDAEVWILYHALPIAQLSVSSGGLEVYRNRVIPFTSSLVDPTGAASHPIDIQVINQGEGRLEGSFAVAAIIEAVGTKPLPTIKTVRCKHCGHQWDVPVETAELICPKCGKLTMVYNLAQFRGIP